MNRVEKIESFLWRSVRKTAKLAILLSYPVLSPFFHEKTDMTREEAEKILQDFSPKPSGKCFAENRLVQPFRYDLQIIVPAYNVEKYLRDCMESILNQKTSYTYKVILVDDGSTDSTPALADSYAADARVQTIHQKNQGLSGARNTGLAVIEAKYVMFVDSDDMLADGAIQALMDAAIRHDADIVDGSARLLPWLFWKGRDFEYGKSGPEDCRKVRVTAWGKVFRSRVFQNLCFPVGFWYEDWITDFLIYPALKSAYLVSDYVYVYRMNPDGITHTAPGLPKYLDRYWITELLMEERDLLGLPYDEAYYRTALWRLIVNARRFRKMPENVRKGVFVLSADLVDRYLDAEKFPSAYGDFRKALRRRDFGAYKLYVMTHYNLQA